jgi:hypothetical protein
MQCPGGRAHPTRFMAKHGARVLNGIAEVVLAQGRPVPARSDPELPDKRASHMTLVRETGPLRCLGRSLALGKKATDETNPALNEVGVWRHPYLASETPQELKPADAR